MISDRCVAPTSRIQLGPPMRTWMCVQVYAGVCARSIVPVCFALFGAGWTYGFAAMAVGDGSGQVHKRRHGDPR
jgi:hypothetical protein